MIVVFLIYIVLQPSTAATNFYFFNFLSLPLPPPNNCLTPTPYILPQSHAVSNVPSAGDTDFWLVVVSSDLMTATYGHGPIPLSLNFRRFNSTTKPVTRRPPTRSTTAARPSRLFLYLRRQILFDCCVYSQNGGHPKAQASPHSSLYFSIPLFLPSPAIEPTTPTESRRLAACAWRWGAAAP